MFSKMHEGNMLYWERVYLRNLPKLPSKYLLSTRHPVVDKHAFEAPEGRREVQVESEELSTSLLISH